VTLTHASVATIYQASLTTSRWTGTIVVLKSISFAALATLLARDHNAAARLDWLAGEK
jgi:hypothetical protein